MKWILTLLVFSFTFFSCKKDEAKPKSKLTLLTQGEWHPTMVLGRTSRYHFPDMPVTIEPCDLDNVFRFTTGGEYIVEEGAGSCLDISPISPENGTWEFANDETYLTLHLINPGGVTKDCNIEILDENTLRYTFYDPGIILYYQCTFSH